MAIGESPGPGRPEKNWAQCFVDDLMVIQATEGSMEIFPLLFGVKTVLWPMPAKKGGRWYRGVVEAVVCLMARWHRDEAESSWLRHAEEDAKSDDKGNMTRGYIRGTGTPVLDRARFFLISLFFIGSSPRGLERGRATERNGRALLSTRQSPAIPNTWYLHSCAIYGEVPQRNVLIRYVTFYKQGSHTETCSLTCHTSS